MSTKGDKRLGEILTRDDHPSSVPGSVEEVSETASSLRLKRVSVPTSQDVSGRKLKL